MEYKLYSVYNTLTNKYVCTNKDLFCYQEVDKFDYNFIYYNRLYDDIFLTKDCAEEYKRNYIKHKKDLKEKCDILIKEFTLS